MDHSCVERKRLLRVGCGSLALLGGQTTSNPDR